MDRIEKYRKLGAKAKKTNSLAARCKAVDDFIDLIENYDSTNREHQRARKDISIMVEARFDPEKPVQQNDMDFYKSLLKYLRREKNDLLDEMDTIDA